MIEITAIAKIVLILTMLGDVETSRGGKAITTVGDFTSVKACTHAGQLWLDQIRSYDEHIKATTLCVLVK